MCIYEFIKFVEKLRYNRNIDDKNLQNLSLLLSIFPSIYFLSQCIFNKDIQPYNSYDLINKDPLTRKIWENGNFNIRRYNEIEKIIKNRKLHELNEKDFKDMGIDDCKTANNFYSVFQWCGLNDKSEKCDYKELNAFYYKHSANSIERGIYNCPDQLITIINYHYKNKTLLCR